MNSDSHDSFVESVKHTNEQIPTSSKYQEKSRSEQKSHEEDHYLPGKSLCVAPLPKTVSRQYLVNFLLQFGTVKRQHFGRNSFWIEYDDR